MLPYFRIATLKADSNDGELVLGNLRAAHRNRRRSRVECQEGVNSCRKEGNGPVACVRRHTQPSAAAPGTLILAAALSLSHPLPVCPLLAGQSENNVGLRGR